MKRVLACLLAALLLLQPLSASAISFDLDPGSTLSEPTEEGTEPTEDGTEPTEDGTEPTEDGTEPTEDGTEPTEDGTEPTEDGTEPTEDGTEPTEDGTEPTEDGTEPTEDSTEPTEDGTEPTEDGEEEVIVPFSCHTLDAQGNKLNAYWSEEEAVWYLFIPAAQDLADIAIHYTGTIVDTTAGEVDQENAVITGAFTASGERIRLTTSDESVHTVVVMQSKLPSVHITLNGITLDQVHQDKDTKHKNNTISIMDPSGEYDLLVENSVEFKGRGNSTWAFFDKKGYQIKFDSKTSVLGMDKSKKWVLLANASDDSMIRTQLVYHMASQLGMAYVPEFEYVDLWINGEYRGTYIIGEKIELGSSRLELEHEAGALFELDDAFYKEEDYWFYSDYLLKHFVMKEIVTEEEDVIQSAMDDFSKAVDELASYLYSTPSNEVTLEALSTMIDVDSFVKYFLINEYVMNKESFVTSFYWYKDGPDDIIHLGPIWDFDTCMGNDGTPFTDSYGQQHFLFSYLLAVPEFHERVVVMRYAYQETFASMITDVDAILAQISDSASMNYIRWNVLGKPNPKGGSDFHATFEDAVSFVKNWLTGREAAFEVVQSKAVTSVVSEDCYEMEITLQDDSSYNSVRFGVWSVVDGQDDLTWYDAYQNADGTWGYIVDLSKHHSAGLYRIDAYANHTKPWVATGCNYVAEVRESPYAMSAEVTANCRTLKLALQDSDRCPNITFAVWSHENGQDDLKWYTAERNEQGVWTYDVDLGVHHTAGTYTLHAYTGEGSTRRLIAECEADVKFAVYSPALSTEVSPDGTKLALTLEHAAEYDRVEIAIRGTDESQDPLPRYEAKKNSDGVWVCNIDLSAHGGPGVYQIDVYGLYEKSETLLVHTELFAQCKITPVYRLYNPVTQEHLLTANKEEMAALQETGWLFDGIAWNAPTTGLPVYRLYNPYDDWHTYSMSDEEISTLTELGWTIDGIVFTSAEDADARPVYRLFNPYEQKNYHLLTASEDECRLLLERGWTLDGIALSAAAE